MIRGTCSILMLAVGLLPAACLCVSGEEPLPGSDGSAAGSYSQLAHTHSHSHEEGGEPPHSHEECSCAGSGIDMFSDSPAKVAAPPPVLIDAVPLLPASFQSGAVSVRPPKVTDTGPPGESNLPLYLAFRKLAL